MKYATYVLYSPKYDRYYIGYTNNLLIRLRQHNESKFGWTKKYRPWKIAYQNEHTAKSEAMIEEKYLKSLKSKKAIKFIIANYYRGVEE